MRYVIVLMDRALGALWGIYAYRAFERGDYGLSIALAIVCALFGCWHASMWMRRAA